MTMLLLPIAICSFIMSHHVTLGAPQYPLPPPMGDPQYRPQAMGPQRYPDTAAWEEQRMIARLLEQQSNQMQGPMEDNTFSTEGLGLGQVAAVDVDSNGDLFVFHRADRPWTGRTFVGDALTPSAQASIGADTIVKVDSTTGRYISSFGKNFFNVPHGLKVDSSDNVWVTDVGRHQVFRFPKNSSTPDLTIGEKFIYGSDESHFCKPTDVAVASNGDFFVADGYCNSRVMKFSKDGTFISSWGEQGSGGSLTPFTLNIVHSVTLVEELDLICAADRENERALCYNAGVNSDREVGTFNRTLVPQGDMGKVFAIYYNKADKTMVAAGFTAPVPYIEAGLEVYPARAFTYTLDAVNTKEWAYITPTSARYGPSQIHDLCASRDGSHFFLADLLQRRVIRYNKISEGGYQDTWY